MKITKHYLKKIINEEIDKIMQESGEDEDKETEECGACGGTGKEWGETCVTCGGKKRIEK